MTIMRKEINRDIQLDIYRGLSMMYVVCFIHVLYWFNIGKEPYISIVLVEMPIIFFISGASISLGNRNLGFLEYFKNRFKRVIIPYYIYAIVILLLIVLLSLFWNSLETWGERILGHKFVDRYNFDITMYTLKDFINIFIGVNIFLSPYSWHLWFILPYMIITCTFSFQSVVIKKINRWIYVTLCVLFFILIRYITDNELITNVFCYNIFFVIGYLFYKKVQIKEIIALYFFFVLSVYTLLLSGQSLTPMQNHKFPPDLLFICYNMGVLCLLSIVLKHFELPNLKIFRLWNTRGYTIYLYQNCVYFVVSVFYAGLIKKIQSDIVKCIICSFIIFLLSTLLSKYTFKLEKIATNYLQLWRN